MRNTPHRFVVQQRSITPGPDGRATYTYDPEREICGIFGILSAQEAADWQGEDVEASARVGLDTEVSVDDRVTVLTPSDTHSSGDWHVVAVRPNRDHLRLMLRKVSR